MKGYRTVFVTTLKMIIDSGIFTTLLMVDWETAGFAPKTAVWLALGLSISDKVITLYMRSITTSPLGKKL